MHLFDLTGKTALITGASSGLGEQFARCLSSAGARVILAARRVEKLNALAAELNNAKALEMNVADKSSVLRAFHQLEAAGEKIDICINNAGIGTLTPMFGEDKDSDFENMIQTNLMGVWYVSKAVTNHMRNHGIHGSIINIGSVNGANKLVAQIGGYCASKAAVIQLTKALVGELAEHNIRINCINPGYHKTPMTADRVDNESTKSELEKQIPLGFIANPADIDGLILYLASNQASRYVTGSIITVDGGISWGGS